MSGDVVAGEEDALVWSRAPFAWGSRTLVMAILNATPDSFSGDGIAGDVEAALRIAMTAEAQGADLIDIGAESTRPRHIPVDSDDEIRRLIPVIEAVRLDTTLPISVDTSKAEVGEAALRAGATIVNDVRGFTADPELAQVVAAWGVPAVVMHDVVPDGHGDLVTSITRELSRRLDRAAAAGIQWDRLVIDPGFGFGKDWRQNLELLRRLRELTVLGRPIFVGMSRKSTIGRVLGVAEHDRLEGTLAATALAIANGADVVRVHDVAANSRVARMTDAVVRGAPAEPKGWEGQVYP